MVLACWTEVDQGGQYWRIAANMQSEVVWALSRTDNNQLYKFENSVWSRDESQTVPVSGLNWNAVAVAPNGEPAYVTTGNELAWKKDGKWIFFKNCTLGVAIGADGTLYRRDCDDFVNRYVDGKWERLSQRKCSRMAVGEDGRVWIRDKEGGEVVLIGGDVTPV